MKLESDRPISVFVKTLAGPSMKLSLLASSTVSSVHQALIESWDLQPHEIRLLFKGIILTGSANLASFGVHHGSTIHLVMRLQAGGGLCCKRATSQEEEKRRKELDLEWEQLESQKKQMREQMQKELEIEQKQKELESERKEKMEACNGNAVPRPTAAVVESQPAPADHIPQTVGKAFSQSQDIQDILRSLKSGLAEEASGTDFSGTPSDHRVMAAAPVMPKDIFTQATASNSPAPSFGWAEDQPRDVSAVEMTFPEGSPRDIDDLGGSMVAMAKAEEASAWERARNAEKRAQEAAARLHKFETEDIAKQSTMRAHLARENQEVMVQEAAVRTRQAEERASDAERRAQESENKFLGLWLEKQRMQAREGTEDQLFAAVTEGVRHMSQAATPEGSVCGSVLQSDFDAVELRLQESEEKLAREKARALAAESRIDRARVKEKLVADQLVKTQAMLEKAKKDAEAARKEADEEATGAWGDDSDEEAQVTPPESPVGRLQVETDLPPPRDGAEALQRLKAQQRLRQQEREQSAPNVNANDWRDSFNRDLYPQQQEEQWQFCVGVRDCGGKRS